MFERTYNTRVLVYDQDLYHYVYKAVLPDGRVIRYGREYVNLGDPPHWVEQKQKLVELGVRESDWIIVAGCGFSPLLTAFGNGHATVGVDPSPYIQQHQGTETDVVNPILPYTMQDPKLEEALTEFMRPFDRFRLERRFDWVVSDDVLSSVEGDAVIGEPGASEAERFLAACDRLALRSIHFVTTGPPGAGYGHDMFTYMLLEDWHQYAPHHVWVDANTFEVLTDG